MTLSHSVVCLCVALALVGCKKKAQPEAAAGDEGGAAAAPAAEGGAAEAASTDEGGAEAAATAEAGSAEAGADEGGDDDSGTDSGPAPKERGTGFAGTYNCFGGITLTQAGNTLSGSGTSRTAGNANTTDITCRIKGDQCVGNTVGWLSLNGGAPKPNGRGKITLRLTANGLEYTHLYEKNTLTGVCKRL